MKLSQVQRLYNLLSDLKSHRTDEILTVIYGVGGPSCANVSGRISDVRKKYDVRITCTRDKQRRTLRWYRIANPDYDEAMDQERFDEIVKNKEFDFA